LYIFLMNINISELNRFYPADYCEIWYLGTLNRTKLIEMILNTRDASSTTEGLIWRDSFLREVEFSFFFLFLSL
jgi:hypothetical protein